VQAAIMNVAAEVFLANYGWPVIFRIFEICSRGVGMERQAARRQEGRPGFRTRDPPVAGARGYTSCWNHVVAVLC